MPRSEHKREKNEDNSGDEQDREPVPTTSKDPARTSHNMNDLAAIDFNSADEVSMSGVFRQAMKASIYGKVPHSFVDQSSQIHVHKQSAITSPVNIDRRRSNHKYYDLKSGARNGRSLRVDESRPVAGCSRKRPGRPKRGPSRKIQKLNYDSIYTGKLRDVVPFKNRRRNYQDSDAESLISFN